MQRLPSAAAAPRSHECQGLRRLLPPQGSRHLRLSLHLGLGLRLGLRLDQSLVLGLRLGLGLGLGLGLSLGLGLAGLGLNAHLLNLIHSLNLLNYWLLH